MVKSFYLLLATATIVSSCANRGDDMMVIGVSQCSEDLWRETVNSEMQRQASVMRNIEVRVKSARDDSQQQIRDIREFMREGVDLMIVSPNESEALTPVVSEVYRSGIPVILFDRKTSNDEYTAYVGADNRRLAERLGVYAADLLHGEGEVAIIRGLKGSTADEERYEGFMDAISDYPDIHVVAESFGNFLKDNARAGMDRILQNPSMRDGIDLVFAMNDQMAMGVRESYDLHPGLHVPVIIGIDAIDGPGGGVEAIAGGRINASFMYPTGGYKLIEIAGRILNGQSFDRENLLNTAVVDRSNVRIIQMQNQQINEQQGKVDMLRRQLADNNYLFTRQRSISRVLAVCLIVFALLVGFLYITLRKLEDMKKKLDSRNAEMAKNIELLNQKQDEMNTLYRQLEEATQAKLLFFTDISHEFKTPLTLILGPVGEMLKSGNLSPSQHDALKLVQRNGNKLMNLLNQILEFRTYENGKMSLNAEVDRLDLFLQDINRLFQLNMVSKHVTLEFVTDGEDYTMAFDKDKMDKIYFNFLSNALKYVDKGGTIRVSLSQFDKDSRRFVDMSIFNSGSFIPEDKLGLVFKRFYRLDNEHGNSGIGLALAKSLIEIHGGSVWAESDGEGTTFRMVLPLVRTVEHPECASGTTGHAYIEKQLAEARDFTTAAASCESYGSCDPSKPKVLVIEDNPDMRQYIKLVLSNSYNVILAVDGQEGINRALQHIPALIITDVLMPKVNGFEVCRTLKSNMITRNIPIICLTACATDEQKIESYASGADAYMSKPFNANVLRARASQLIDKGRAAADSQDADIIIGVNTRTLGDKQQQFLQNFRAYVEEHIYDNISINSIAEALGMSRSTMYRQFNEITDVNPVEVITMIRLKKAVRAMLFERKSVAQAAFDAGFSSPSYFTKTFIKYYKEKPSDYQKRYTRRSPEEQ